MAATKKGRATDAILRGLRDRALARYPGAHTKSPWPGHLDLAVKDKTFAYLSLEGEPFKISCKLPLSCELALVLPHTSPTEYGLGKSGWVSFRPPEGAPLDVEMLEAWIDESYRAQAPKKLVAELDTRSGVAPATKTSTRRATVKKRSGRGAPQPARTDTQASARSNASRRRASIG
jgi:predicted DNA-binding protein (MmcQ/YjbR family)